MLAASMSAPVPRFVLLVLLALSGTHAFFLPAPAVPSSTTSSTRLHGGIKGVETFDGAFTLSPESESVLFDYLQCDVSGWGRGGGGREGREEIRRIKWLVGWIVV